MMSTYVIVLVLLIVIVLLAAAILVMRCRASHPKMGGGAFRLKVSDPEYTSMLKGKKTVEARPDREGGIFSRLKEKDPIVVVRSRPVGDTSEYPGGKYKFNATIDKIKKYGSIKELIESEKLSKVYPDRKTTAEAIEQYNKYVREEDRSLPVLAIHLSASGAATGAGFDDYDDDDY
jgi:ASC-1-like (ASCH) protein